MPGLHRFKYYLSRPFTLVYVLGLALSASAWVLSPSPPSGDRGVLAGLILVFLALLGMAWTRRRAIDAISQTAQRISMGDFSSHVREEPPHEFRPLAASVNLLADRVQSMVTELTRQKSRLSIILDNMVEAVVAVDTASRILSVNPALCRLFGISRDSAEGKPMLEVLRHGRLNELVSRSQQELGPVVDEINLFTPDERVFQARAAPLMQDGQCSGALLVLHDITILRKLEQVRRDFVANVSHELRTPLAAIKGYAETLRTGALDDPQHRLEFVETIEKHADRLTRIVDDLLQLASIESGQRPPAFEPVPVLDVAREVAGGLQTLAGQRRVVIEIDVAGGLPPVRADRGRLKQVLTNLIDNAIKYNRETGTVTIAAVARERDLLIEVRDTGIGIPKSDLSRIFERFYRVDKARSRELGGTGLGLSIVKHIVESHGGAVWAESEWGKGATFWFTLPLYR